MVVGVVVLLVVVLLILVIVGGGVVVVVVVVVCYKGHLICTTIMEAYNDKNASENRSRIS